MEKETIKIRVAKNIFVDVFILAPNAGEYRTGYIPGFYFFKNLGRAGSIQNYNDFSKNSSWGVRLVGDYPELIENRCYIAFCDFIDGEIYPSIRIIESYEINE